ncbi:Tn3 family transposase [Streptomyces mirabilis]|uniref:Tn3 family transposase n=1 Tax=Streptomyces mirabilis TaxID=68239 RepID=UPI0036960BB0
MAAEGVVLFLQNAVIFHNAWDIAEIVRQLLEEGWTIEPEDLARISPYLTEHIKRFASTPHMSSVSSPRRTNRSWRWTSPAARAGPDGGRLRSGRLIGRGRVVAKTTRVIVTTRDEHSRSWASSPTRTPTELDRALFGVDAAVSGLSKRVAAWSTNRTLVARRLRLRVRRRQVTVGIDQTIPRRRSMPSRRVSSTVRRGISTASRSPTRA